MFIFSFLGDIIQIGGGLFLAGYLWQDYRKGWIGVHFLMDKGYQMVEKISFGMLEGPAQSAGKRLKESGKKLENFRSGVAEAETIVEECEKRAGDFLQLIKEAEALEEQAVKNSHHDALEQLVRKRLVYQKNVEIYAGAGEEFSKEVALLRKGLMIVETEHDKARLRSDRIRLDLMLAEANTRLYELTSQVEGGVSHEGGLLELEDQARHERVKSQKMLALARGGQDGHVTDLQQQVSEQEIQSEIQAVIARVSAYPAIEANSSNAIAQVAEEAEIMEAGGDNSNNSALH